MACGIFNLCCRMWGLVPWPGLEPGHPCIGSTHPPALFLKKIFFFKLEDNYNIVMVLPYINMNQPWVYTCSPSWTPLPPPSPYHPSGSSQYTSPKHPVSCIEPGLVTHLIYIILYIFQCHSPKSSHSLPLPQSPKDCSIHQCLFCCLVHRVIVTIFLNSIYLR